MKKLQFSTLLFTCLLLQTTLQSFANFDRIQESLKLDLSPKKNNFSTTKNSNSLSIAAFHENYYGIAYIDNQSNLNVAFLQSGKIKAKNEQPLTTTKDVNSVQVLPLTNEQLLIAYSTKNSPVGIENFHFLTVNKETGAIISPSTPLITNANTSFLKLKKINSEEVAVVYSIKEDQMGWKLRLKTYNINSNTFSSEELSPGIAPATPEQKQWNEYNASITILSDNILLIVYQGNGPLASTIGKSEAIFRKQYSIRTGKPEEIPDENTIQIIGQENLLYEQPQVVTLDNNKDQYALIWILKEAIYYSLFDKDHTPICTNGSQYTLIEKQASFPSITTHKNIAYIVYLKEGKTMGLEVNIGQCDIERDTQVIQQQEVPSNTYPVQATTIQQDGPLGLLNPTPNVLLVLSLTQLQNETEIQYSLYLSEYFLSQTNKCETNGCQGCYGDYTCPICAGSTPDIRLLQSRKLPTCECIEGYYKQNDDIDCGRCERQCKSCNSSNECLECQNPEMMLPGCLYLKKGNFKYLEDGIWHYEQCSPRCESCKNEKNGQDQCISCLGAHRINNGTCACETGFHDNNGELQDCIRCNDDCLQCQSAYICNKCDESKDKILDVFTGQCVCKPGFEYFDEFQIECKKCYKLSDGCVKKCPENTLPNDQKMICEYKEKITKNETSPMLFVFAGAIGLFQVCICCCIYHKLKKNYKIFVSEKIEHWQKIKQQRDFIYNGMEGGRSNLGNNLSEQIIDTQMNINTESPFKLRKDTSDPNLRPSDTEMSYVDLQQSNIKLLGASLDKSNLHQQSQQQEKEKENLNHLDASLDEDLEQKKIEEIQENEEENEIISQINQSQHQLEDSQVIGSQQSQRSKRSKRMRKNRSNLQSNQSQSQQTEQKGTEHEQNPQEQQEPDLINLEGEQQQQEENLDVLNDSHQQELQQDEIGVIEQQQQEEFDQNVNTQNAFEQQQQELGTFEDNNNQENNQQLQEQQVQQDQEQDIQLEEVNEPEIQENNQQETPTDNTENEQQNTPDQELGVVSDQDQDEEQKQETETQQIEEPDEKPDQEQDQQQLEEQTPEKEEEKQEDQGEGEQITENQETVNVEQENIENPEEEQQVETVEPLEQKQQNNEEQEKNQEQEQEKSQQDGNGEEKDQENQDEEKQQQQLQEEQQEVVEHQQQQEKEEEEQQEQEQDQEVIE